MTHNEDCYCGQLDAFGDIIESCGYCPDKRCFNCKEPLCIGQFVFNEITFEEWCCENCKIIIKIIQKD